VIGTAAIALPVLTTMWAPAALGAGNVPLPRERPGAEGEAAATDTGETASSDAAVATDETASGRPLPRARPDEAGPAAHELARRGGFAAPVVDPHAASLVTQALGHIGAGRFGDALSVQRRLSDPAAKTLIEFYYVRDRSLSAPHSRIAAFLDAHPDWPNRQLVRGRYEVALHAQGAGSQTILAAFEETGPTTTIGTIIHARALNATGETDRARAMITDLWRTKRLSSSEEDLVLKSFSKTLGSDDHKARMDMLLYDNQSTAAARAARRVGGHEAKLAEARMSVNRRSKSAAGLLDRLPQEVRDDPGYVLSRVQWNRRAGRLSFAAEVLQKAEFDPDQQVDPDEWALERRVVARDLIETGDPDNFRIAYDLVSQHHAEAPIDRLENEFYAGWIALRFMDDPDAAKGHFEEILAVAKTPISRARGEYWLGRAAEEAGDVDTAVERYIAAGHHATTYYGQLALVRLGRTMASEPDKPLIADTARRVVGKRDSIRAMRLLAQIGRRDDAARLMISMANETDDALTLVGLSETAERMNLKWGTVWIGKRGMRAGAPTEAYAFSNKGMPDYDDVGPGIDPAVVYAIARQESVFNPAAVSPAGARGLMQMMPATAKATARTFGQRYDLGRLTSDPRYNATLGAAHLGELADEFDHAYALVFAAYNAGGGRVYQWIERFGDPRKGEIDPIDWVESIPFHETRNYVQRVMEGLQVYRASLGSDDRLLIAEDLRIPITAGQSVIAATASGASDPGSGNGDSGGVPGVFSGFSDGPRESGGDIPSTALGFGGYDGSR